MENIRVKIKLDGINYNSFLIKDFHYVPRANDLIEVQNFIDENNYTNEELDKIHSLAWEIMYVNWNKDDLGFFAEINCSGS